MIANRQFSRIERKQSEALEVKLTPHPEWVKLMLHFLRPYQDRVAKHPFFESFKRGSLSLAQCQAALINFYPLIESFPQYMALSLSKLPPGDSPANRVARDWLISNISQERVHG